MGLRARIQDLIDQGDLTQAYLMLANRALNDAPFHEYPWLVKALANCVPTPMVYRVGLLSTFTLEPINACLKALAMAQGFDLNLYFGGFQQLEQEILVRGSGLVRHEPQLIIIAWRLEDLSPVLWNSLLELTEREIQAEVTSVLDRCKDLLETCKSNFPKTQLLLHSFVPPPYPALGIIDFEHRRGQRQTIDSLNAGLREIVTFAESAHILDCEMIAWRSGSAWFDARHWYSARSPLGPQAFVALAWEYNRFIRALVGKSKKVLVLDLDNTLWGGVLGEDGLEGISLGPNYPGNTYVAFQKEIKQLSRRGVVLSINSKNNESDVREAFEKHRHMVLKWNDFAALRVNWQDKITNMHELSKELSLGLDSFVFIDDSPYELEMVQQALPSISVVEVPREPSDLPGLLSRLGYFESVIYSEEDRKRGEFYRMSTKRMQLKQSSTDLESFYQSLSMCLTVYNVTESESPRVAQLTQRTNQFNMTTRRYTESDIERFRKDQSYIVRAYRLEDRFGDNGIISVVIVNQKDRVWYLDTFLMSCRVIGRKVERAILGLLVQEAKKIGIKALVGEFRPTKKNAPAKDIFIQHGFKKVEESKNCKRWKLELADTNLKVPEFFQVNPIKSK